MQPLKATVRPSSSSTIGWSPAADRSMILSRRWARATGPAHHEPDPSGPRAPIVSAIRSTASRSGGPLNAISPAKPHIGQLKRWLSAGAVALTVRAGAFPLAVRAGTFFLAVSAISLSRWLRVGGGSCPDARALALAKRPGLALAGAPSGRVEA